MDFAGTDRSANRDPGFAAGLARETYSDYYRLRYPFDADVTGRPRRVGWFDAVPLRYAVAVNSVSSIMLNKLDILSGLDEIQFCAGYTVDEAPDGAAACLS